MAEFHETYLGTQFYKGYVPRMVIALESIATQLEKLNKQLADNNNNNNAAVKKEGDDNNG